MWWAQLTNFRLFLRGSPPRFVHFVSICQCTMYHFSSYCRRPKKDALCEATAYGTNFLAEKVQVEVKMTKNPKLMGAKLKKKKRKKNLGGKFGRRGQEIGQIFSARDSISKKKKKKTGVPMYAQVWWSVRAMDEISADPRDSGTPPSAHWSPIDYFPEILNWKVITHDSVFF